jgi:hypothetical protein
LSPPYGFGGCAAGTGTPLHFRHAIELLMAIKLEEPLQPTILVLALHCSSCGERLGDEGLETL